MDGLQIENIVKIFPGFRLEARFHVTRGERGILLGESGSGKTTLLNVIAGLDRGHEGQISLGGRAIEGLGPEARNMGFVFQDHALFSSMDVLDNVVFGLRVRGVSESIRKEQGLDWLRRIGLTDRRHADVDTLSGGEKSRVAFARALIFKPECLLLDEPFSALDAGTKEVMRGLLRELHESWPVPMLLVTHDESDVGSLGGRPIRIQKASPGVHRVHD